MPSRRSGDQGLDDVAHDAVEPRSPSACRPRPRPPPSVAGTSASGMMPPTTTGMSRARPSAAITSGISSRCEPREDRQADHVDALVDRRAGDLRRRQADALVDDVHARVARARRRSARRRWSGRRGPACRPGSSGVRPSASLTRATSSRSLLERRREGGRLADAGRARGRSRRRRAARPPTRRWSRPRARRRASPSMMFSSLAATRRSSSSAARRRPRAARQARQRRRASASTPGSTTRIPPSSAVSGEGSVSVKTFTPTSTCSPASIRAIRARWDSTSAAFMYGTASTAPPRSSTRRHLRARALQQLADEPVHDDRALEDVRVVEQVGLVGQHLLDSQRPLLVPRAREAQRLVPGGQLHARARARRAPASRPAPPARSAGRCSRAGTRSARAS